ncbi:hypothetical protein EON65_15565 [archaeon]|nr:MAG: hypothetical protein EON65_15565 [archaeon]
MVGQHILLTFCVVCFILTVFSDDSVDWLRGGKCKGKWRLEKLIGKCPGLRLHSDYSEVKHINKVENASSCRAICCNLGDKCATWQFEVNSQECRLGQVARLGGEALGVGGWCEPNAPVQWNGRKVASREGTKVTWSVEVLDTQCFGLGAERKSPMDGSRLNTEQCTQACANDLKCGTWQEYPGRGCFYHEHTNNCDPKKGAKYEGGRKCIPGYCGGMEEQLLGMKIDPKDWDRLRQEHTDRIKNLH